MSENYPRSKYEHLAVLALLSGKLSPTDGRKWRLLKKRGWVDDKRNISAKGVQYGETVKQNKAYQEYFDGI